VAAFGAAGYRWTQVQLGSCDAFPEEAPMPRRCADPSMNARHHLLVKWSQRLPLLPVAPHCSIHDHSVIFVDTACSRTHSALVRDDEPIALRGRSRKEEVWMTPSRT
jgi:hypothetical protein